MAHAVVFNLERVLRPVPGVGILRLAAEQLRLPACGELQAWPSDPPSLLRK